MPLGGVESLSKSSNDFCPRPLPTLRGNPNIIGVDVTLDRENQFLLLRCLRIASLKTLLEVETTNMTSLLESRSLWAAKSEVGTHTSLTNLPDSFSNAVLARTYKCSVVKRTFAVRAGFIAQSSQCLGHDID